MSRYHSYLKASVTLIETHKQGAPFALHLKSFFSAHKKMGSKDRKIVASVCYDYFRCKSLFSTSGNLEDKLLKAVFICEQLKENNLLAVLSADLHEKLQLSIAEKLALLNLDSKNLFAFQGELSEQVDKDAFTQSFLKQPSLYLRIRPGRDKKVFDLLLNAGVQCELMNQNCIKLKTGIDIAALLQLNKDVVVQDANSQRVFDGLDKFLTSSNAKSSIEIWDACAASGGKSILIHDLLKGKVKLTLSDIRNNILNNLSGRLGFAGISIFKKFTTDLTKSSGLNANEKFDMVICDAPCTGSGTWARTPEQQSAISADDIAVFAAKQLAILQNILPHLAQGGLLVYITCSVFKKENEAVLEQFMQANKKVKLLQSQYYKGYETAADTLFSAILTC
jgi:16S rRNA (cytosine967-C5)-methyltransferase